MLDTLPDYADVKQTALEAFYALAADGALSDLRDIRALDRLVYARVNAYINAQATEKSHANFDAAPDYFTRVRAAASNAVDDNGAEVSAAVALDNVATADALRAAINAVSSEYGADAARVLRYLSEGRKMREISEMKDIPYGKSWVHKTVKRVRAFLIKNPELFTDIFGVSPAAIRY